MANKIISGVVTSVKMKGSVVVTVTRKTPHRLYKKLIRKSKNYIVDAKGMDFVEGQMVEITPARKLSSNKHFTILKKGEK